jgi:copper chaperone CopZ
MKNMKIIYAIGFGVMTLFGIYYYQDIIFNKTSSKQASSNHNVDLKSSHRKFNVAGMYCESCKTKIETAVSALPGVTAVTINQATNEMVVSYVSSNENVKETLDTVKQLGYTIGLKSNSGRLQVMDFNVKFQ